MGKIGVFGGSFDPLHIGHLMMAQFALEEAALDCVYFMPNGRPPHKSNRKISSGQVRLEMCKRAVLHKEKFDVLDYEIKNTQKIHYTIDTIDYLTKNKFSGDRLFFIVGADSVFQIETWKSFQSLLKKVTFLCFNRGEKPVQALADKIERLERTYGARIIVINMPVINISSTLIRERVSHGQSICYMVSPEVQEYIEKNGLYKDGKND